MPALDPIANPARLPITLGTSPATRALTSAEEVRHTETVPGQSDNDSDSWRKHMVDGLAANLEAIRQAQARLDTFGNFIDEDGFAVVTADQAEAGYAYQARDGALPANESLALVPGNQDTAIGSVPSSGIVLYMRVPAGIDPATVRIDHRRGTSLVASYPRASDAWERTTALTGRSPHYDYYRLVDDALGSVISISGVQAGDTFVMRVHGHDSSVPPIETLRVIPDDEALPDVADHPDTLLLLWRGQFYRRESVTDGEFSFSFRSGTYNPAGSPTTYGVSAGLFGQFIVNPSNNFDDLASESGFGTLFYVDRNAYRAAKGSNEVAGDAITLNLVTGETPSRSGTIELRQSGHPLAGPDGRTYIPFQSTSTISVLDADSVGDDITVTLQRGGSDFMTVPSGLHVAWVVVDLVQTQLNAQAIQDIRDQLANMGSPSDPHTSARVDALEAKTAGITFSDDQPVWQTEPNTAVGGKHPYGGWMWVPSGGNAASYAGQDYDDFTHAGGSGFAGAGRGLLWVLPNDLSWDHVRLVVRRADGTIRSSVNAQTGLRNAPASVVVANLPSAPPDVTVRWSASSDTQPYAVSNIEATDTIALEVLHPDHEPVWNDDISDALRERVAANEVQLASINQQLENDIANPVFRDILEVDDNSDWDGSTERFRIFSHTVADVKDGDFVEIDWLNFNTTTDIFQHFAIHGSTETQGRFIFHGRDLAQRSAVRPNTVEGSATSQANGFIGATTGVLRRQLGENLVDDPGGAVIRWFLYRVGTTVHLDAVASIVRNPMGMGKMPEGFYLRSRTWRESAQVQSTRLLPDRPNAVEDRRGLVPKFDSEGSLGYDQAIGPIQLLAFRSRITGDWTLGAPTGELTVTDLGFSGTTLRINARKALRSKSYGVLVTVTRGTDEISRVLIPWSLFRTGSGTYVTGGGHGTQGIPVGYWSDAANAYLVATADWDFDNDRFELIIRGANTDTNSILRVHLAR